MPARFTKLVPRLRAEHLLAGGGLCMGLVLALGLGWFAIAARQGDIADAAREIGGVARMLADQQDRLLQSADLVQLGLINHMRAIGVDSPEIFEQRMASREVSENLQDRLAGLTYVAALSLFDRYGKRLNVSNEGPPPVAEASRDFIRALTAEGTTEIYIGAPSFNDVAGQWTIYLSRRFAAADGRLIGFVSSAIHVGYFEQDFGRLKFSGGGAFRLYRTDGLLMARYPRHDAEIGTTAAGSANFNRLLGSLDDGVVRQADTSDGKDRLIVPRAMPRFPLIVAVSDSLESILGAWREETRILLAANILLDLAIAGTVLLASRQLRGGRRLLAAETARARAEADLDLAGQRERAAQTLQIHESRFDMTLHTMLQGLVMVDHDGNLLVANRRWCELFDLPPDIVRPGMSHVELIRLLSSRGNVRAEDAAVVAQRRNELLGRKMRSTFIWELSDGRAFSVTHQPMEEGWLTTSEDITERREIEARITHLAHHDTLTSLPNRVLLREKLGHALALAPRGSPLALLCLDLDQFKAVNDTLGHPVGDGLLREVAHRIRGGSRDTDMFARLGGDEFAIVRSGIESPLEATRLASKLIESLEAPFEIDGHRIIISASIGIAFAPQDSENADQLLKCADLALHRAKRDGRGTYRLFQADMDAAMQARRVMELDLRQALSVGQLEVFFQPQIDVRGRRIAGCEALLRWRHPTMGLVPPGRFISLAEETGLIVPIGEWVLRQACTVAASWPGDLKISVNLSAVQFKSPDLVDAVVDALRGSGLSASRLELEITETVLLQDTDNAVATLHRLREMGIQIAMDDFGTGYSSLSYLRRFPFDRIKIDQSFIRELGEQDDCIAIVRAVIALGRDLGMAITAEGVETRQQLDTLERAGCNEVQGYLFSRPVPASAVSALLRSMPIIEEVWPRSGARARVRSIEAKESSLISPA